MTVTADSSLQLLGGKSVQPKAIDYLELYVGNARQAAYFYRTAFGLTPMAYAGLETGDREKCSFVLQQSNIRLVVTSGITPEGAIAEHVKLHGDGVRDIALLVDDAADAFKTAVARGAKPLLEPTRIEGDRGYVVKATIASCSGDLVHSFIERKNYCGFSPEFIPLPDSQPVTPMGLREIDHIAINVELGKMDVWADFYDRVMGLYQSQHFTSDDISTKYSSLMSKVLENSTGRVKFAINEPALGIHKSQIQEYLDFYGGAGVQHIAIATDDIIKTVCQLRANGVEFLAVPDGYYENLHQRIGSIDEDLNVLKELSILLDRDEDGYLLQIFTKPLTDRPTIFFEIIQRQGARGFGNGNFKALFEAIEREQALRGNL